MLDLIKAVSLGITLLLPLTNPLTTIAIYLGLTGDMSTSERHRQSLMTSVYVFIIMMVAYYAGHFVMSTFGISIPGLRIAGGAIVSFIGFHMLFPSQGDCNASGNQVSSGEMNTEKVKSIAFIPLAMPGTAGPGTIAMIISTASSLRSNPVFPEWIVIIAPPLTFFIISMILWLSLRSSGAIIRCVGNDGIDAVSRLMGFLLVCIGAQFIINSILEIIKAYN